MTASAQRDMRIARILDREVAPIWHDRFARLLFHDLPEVDEGIVLDAAAETGRTTLELLARYGPNVRVVAFERDEAKLALARGRIGAHFRDRVYLREADPAAVAEMADDSCAAVFANLFLGDSAQPEELLKEFVRVTRPGGEVRATLPMRGTWAEVEDLLYEILLQEKMTDGVRRLSRLARLRPTGPVLAQRLLAAGTGDAHMVVEQRRFQLLFASGREFLFSPPIEHGPLRLWKAIIGKANDPQRIFWRLKETIDTYFSGRVFATTVVAGVVRVEVPQPGRTPLARRYFAAYPTLAKVFFGGGAQDEGEEFDLDIDVVEEGAPAAAAGTASDELDRALADLGRELAVEPGGRADVPGGTETEADAELRSALAEASHEGKLEEVLEGIDDELQLIDDPDPPLPAEARKERVTGVRLRAVGDSPPPPPPRRRTAPPPPPPPRPRAQRAAQPTRRMGRPPPPPPPPGKKRSK